MSARWVLVLLGGLSSGCIAEVWAGGGVAKPPGPDSETRAAFTFGASIGTYLDPQVTRVRVGYATHSEKMNVNVAEGSTLSRKISGSSSIRADVILNPEVDSDDTLTRATAIATFGTSNSYVEQTGLQMDPAGTPWTIFAGITRSIADREQRNAVWSDSVSWSLGPAVSSVMVGDDRMWGAGGQLRVTFAISPMTILGYVGLAGSALVEQSKTTSAASSGSSPGPSGSSESAPTPTTTCTTTQRCTRDSNGDQWCVPNTICR